MITFQADIFRVDIEDFREVICIISEQTSVVFGFEVTCFAEAEFHHFDYIILMWGRFVFLPLIPEKIIFSAVGL